MKRVKIDEFVKTFKHQGKTLPQIEQAYIDQVGYDPRQADDIAFIYTHAKNPTFRIPVRSLAKFKKIYAAEDALRRAGVSFDTEYGQGHRDWELDWSLKGAELQDKGQVISKNPKRGSYASNQTIGNAFNIMGLILLPLVIGGTIWLGNKYGPQEN